MNTLYVASSIYPQTFDFVSPIVWLYVNWASNDLYVFSGVIYEVESHINVGCCDLMSFAVIRLEDK